MRKVKLILIGAGMRGMYSYAPYILNHPEEAEFVACADPDNDRSKRFAEKYDIKPELCFEDWRQVLDAGIDADGVLICTQDNMHYEPAIAAMEKGYHVLLEKPMSPDPGECVRLALNAKKYEKILSVCHVLRYTDFFGKIKQLLDEDRIGRLISIQHNENVGHRHMAHSFVRGNWNNKEKSSPMILSKSCHDMDILLWLAGSDCNKISSFGSLTHFKSSNAPVGATKRCTDGCPAKEECPYYAPGTYLGGKGWPTTAVSADISDEALMEALRNGPYGRCVYYCDNDVVDHQVTVMEFDNEITCAFTMSAFTGSTNRSLKLMGTKGEIRATDRNNEIEVMDFITKETQTIIADRGSSGHGGGDENIMRDFIKLINKDETAKGVTSADISVQSHIMSFAAEESRISGKTIDISGYIEKIKKEQINA